MLSLFKEKLLHVQDGISQSLKGEELDKKPKKCFQAGSRLLAKFNKDWEEIHSLSEENAKQATIVDSRIEECHTIVKNQRFALRKFNSVLTDVSSVINLTEQAVNNIGNIRSLVEDVEEKIIELQDLIEQEEMSQKITESQERLEHYRCEHLISFDALRERLAEDYDEKLKKIHSEKEEIQKKNREIAEKKFQEDLNIYKETGQLPKKVNLEPTTSIEEIEIDQDMDQLDNYLKM